MTATARRTDPASSVDAAERHEASGIAKTNRDIVERMVKLHPGETSKALALSCDSCGLDRHEIARRLPELEAAGLVYRRVDAAQTVARGRPVYVGDRDGCFWYPGPAKETKRQRSLFDDDAN